MLVGHICTRRKLSLCLMMNQSKSVGYLVVSIPPSVQTHRNFHLTNRTFDQTSKKLCLTRTKTLGPFQFVQRKLVSYLNIGSDILYNLSDQTDFCCLTGPVIWHISIGRESHDFLIGCNWHIGIMLMTGCLVVIAM